MTNATKKIISLVTLACFVMTQSISANPGAGIDMVRPQETPSFLQIDIPSELATLDGLFEAPSSPDPRLILHIQNAHANYGAQQKIKQLLQYFEKTYAIKTIFVEGASEDLNPDYLKMFPDKERNAKLADFLAKQGELTGAELFILEKDEERGTPQGPGMSGQAGNGERGMQVASRSSLVAGPNSNQSEQREDWGHPGYNQSRDNKSQDGKKLATSDQSPATARAFGIENAALYRENYEALKKVFGAETAVNRYLGGFESRLDGLASKVFTPDLRKLLLEWKKFEKGHREFMPYVHALAAEAKRILGLDLESLFAQVEWPQITRLLVLQTLEKDLNTEKGLSEKATLVQFLKEKKVPGKLVGAIENFQDARVSVLRSTADGKSGQASPRDLMEQLVTEAGPKGFRFSDYPDFSLYAGYLILKSELDPKGLFDEIRGLFTQVLDKLAETGTPVGERRKMRGKLVDLIFKKIYSKFIVMKS